MNDTASTPSSSQTADADQRAAAAADAILESDRLHGHAAFVRANVDLDRALADEAERVRRASEQRRVDTVSP